MPFVRPLPGSAAGIRNLDPKRTEGSGAGRQGWAVCSSILRRRCFLGDALKTLFGTARGIDSFAADARAFLGHRTFHQQNDDRHRKHQGGE